MNYYIKGSAAKAEQIKAAFEKLGINVLDFGFADKTVVYCSIGGCVQYLPYSINLMNILYSHPDYQELELSVKPKPKVGDWVVFNNNHNSIYQIGEIMDSYYKLTHTHGGSMPLPFSQGNFLRPWSIEDAKDGDVLMCESGWTCIFKDSDLFNEMFSSYCFMTACLDFMPYSSECHTLDSRINGKLTPATEQQRNLFFKKMKEAGYQWDADKKELHKIQPHYDIKNFKPKQWVLVRQGDGCAWRPDIFSNLKEGTVCQFECVGNSIMVQCIPYNDDTKHLLGTTDMPSEEYINW